MKNSRIWLSVARSFLFYVIFSVTASLSGLSTRWSPFNNRQTVGFWSDGLYCKVNFFYSMIVFFSLASVFCVHHRFFKESVAEVKKNGILRAVWCRYFLIDSAVIAVCTAISPISPLSDLSGGFLTDLSPVLQRLTAVAIAVPVLIFINFLAYCSTVSWWAGQSKKKSDDGEKPLLKFALQFGLTSVAWVLGGAAMTVVFPMLSTVFIVAGKAKGLLIILAAAAVILSVIMLWGRELKAIRQKKAFVSHLRRLCKDKGAELILSRHPYRSGHNTDGPHLMVKKGEFKLACRFISASSRSTPLYLHDNGTATYVKDRLIYKHQISEGYFFDADVGAQKVIVVCPCRGKVFAKNEHGERLLESGDSVMGHRVYNASGLINAIERGVIEF